MEKVIVRGGKVSETVRVQTLPVAKLQVSEIYQRMAKTQRMAAMADKYDPLAVGLLAVSFRDDTYWVIDGQHRLGMLKLKGIDTVACLVHFGLDPDDEARLFTRYNNSSKVTGMALLKARIAAKERNALDLVRCLSEFGLQFCFSGKTRKWPYVTHCNRLEAVQASLGKEGVKRVLDVVVNGFGAEDPDSLSHIVMGSIGYFVSMRPDASQDRLRAVCKMRNHTAVRLEMEATSNNAKGGGEGRYAAGARVLLDWYNHRLRKDQQLLSLKRVSEDEEQC